MLRLCERGLGRSLVRADVLVESEEVRRALRYKKNERPLEAADRSKFLIAGAGFEQTSATAYCLTEIHTLA
jgi:hypothetical protein